MVKRLDVSDSECTGLPGLGWVRRDARLPNCGRVLVFSPTYPEHDPMRFRVMDAKFVRISTDVSHWIELESISPN